MICEDLERIASEIVGVAFSSFLLPLLRIKGTV